MKKLVIIVLTFIFCFSNIVEAKEVSSSAKYEYFTQDKNITNLSTQLPAKKGLLEKRENGKIKSVGNYQDKTNAPRTRFKIDILITRGENRIYLEYVGTQGDSGIEPSVPIYQQVFREDILNTHIYFIFPKKIDLIKEAQLISALNNKTGKDVEKIFACSPEDTNLSQLLKKYNVAMEGMYKLTKDDRTQLERAFDNTADVIGGRTGKGIKIIKRGVKWGIERDEKRRLDALRKKYGEEYQIYKMLFYVPKGITLAYTHIGRNNVIAFNLLEVTRPTKVFIEIPQLTFELDTGGAIRKASIEELAYEIIVESEKAVNTNNDLPKAIVAEKQKEPYDICREISQEEANSINKELLKKIFLECGSVPLLKTIIRTGKFSRNELCVMAKQSKWSFDSLLALYNCNIISWEKFGRIRESLRKNN